MANLQLIKTLAEKKNLPITELAKLVGVSEQQMHLMVRTGSTKIVTLEKIAGVLGVPVTIFFDEEPKPAGEPKQMQNIKVKTNGDKSPASVNGHASVFDCDPSMKEKITDLEKLINEKDERIAELKERIAELKERIPSKP